MTRDQWRLVLTGYAILTLFWLLGAGWTWKLEGETRDTLKRVQANQERIQRLTASGASLICAVAEGDNRSDTRVMRDYAEGKPLPPLPAVCKAVGDRALARVLGHQ